MHTLLYEKLWKKQLHKTFTVAGSELFKSFKKAVSNVFPDQSHYIAQDVFEKFKEQSIKKDFDPKKADITIGIRRPISAEYLI